jgi:hypothetical protein
MAALALLLSLSLEILIPYLSCDISVRFTCSDNDTPPLQTKFAHRHLHVIIADLYHIIFRVVSQVETQVFHRALQNGRQLN